MIVGDLFSGIGGFSLAAHWMGWRTAWFSEIDPFACRVLAHHWPDVPNLGDICTRSSDVFSGRWPKSGTMRNGVCSPLPTLAPPTCVSACGLWPTPTATMGDKGGRGDLIQVVRGNESPSGHYRQWATPTVQDASNNAGPSQFKRNSLPLNAEVGGALNPQWVAWLMGYPIEHTNSVALAMPSSRSVRSKSSVGSKPEKPGGPRDG